MKTKTTTKNLVQVGTLLILLAIVGVTVYNSIDLNKKLTAQKLKSEMLLAEKLNLDKSISKMGKDLTESKGSNAKLSKEIKDINSDLLAKNKENDRLRVRTANYDALQKKNSDMEQSLHKLNSEIGQLNNSLASASNENKQLNDRLQVYSQTNSGLSSDNSILKAMISDNYRTEASKGRKEKLTVNARRTNKLTVSFDLPGNVKDKLYFKVITPGGQEFSSIDDLHASITISELGDGLLASTSDMIGGAGTKRVEMSFRPNKKLQEGIYQFNLYNEDRFLGSTQLRLR